MSVSSITPTQAPPIHFPQWRRRIYGILGLSILLVVVVALAAAFGSVKIPFPTIWRILIAELPLVDIVQDWPSAIGIIVLEIRLPRVILAGLVGAALATAGATYQGLFRNPLADPYLIGVAQGASLGAVVGFLLPTTWHGMGSGLGLSRCSPSPGHWSVLPLFIAWPGWVRLCR